MSSGGIFILDNNRGSYQDKILTNPELLKFLVKNNRDNSGKINAKSLLANIDDVYVSFVTSYHKPALPCAYFYSKSGPQGGNVNLGGTSRFNFPRDADFISDMCLYVKLTGLATASATDRCAMHRFQDTDLSTRHNYQLKTIQSTTVIQKHTTSFIIIMFQKPDGAHGKMQLVNKHHTWDNSLQTLPQTRDICKLYLWRTVLKLTRQHMMTLKCIFPCCFFVATWKIVCR